MDHESIDVQLHEAEFVSFLAALQRSDPEGWHDGRLAVFKVRKETPDHQRLEDAKVRVRATTCSCAAAPPCSRTNRRRTVTSPLPSETAECPTFCSSCRGDAHLSPPPSLTRGCTIRSFLRRCCGRS